MTTPQSVLELLEQLRGQRRDIDSKIASVEQVLNLLDTDIPEPDSEPAPPSMALATNGHRNVALAGLTIPQAIQAWAGAHGSEVRIRELANEFSRQTGKPADTVSAQIYYRCGKDPLFHKVMPGVFQMASLYDDSLAKSPRDSFRRITKPVLRGRDYSLIAIPPELARFDINSLRGKSPLDAAIDLARYLGGSVTAAQIAAAFWHADLTPTAETPGRVPSKCHSALTTSRAVRYLTKKFQNNGTAVFHLIA